MAGDEVTAEERAQEIAGAVRENRPFDTIYLVALGHIRETERTAASRARREALEEAAKVICELCAEGRPFRSRLRMFHHSGVYPEPCRARHIHALATASDEASDGEQGGG